jgi:Ca2+-binding EF-hand superfamily protein
MKRKDPAIAVDYLILSFRNVVGAAFIVAFMSLAGCAANKNLEPKQEAGIGRSGFDEADANHDGKLSRDEASDFLVNEIFTSRDANHDGRMAAQEWAADDPGRQADFKKRDTNHDGVVTKEEAIAYGRAHGVANKIFREADTNHDGFLDPAEVQAYYTSREGPPS